MFYYMLLLKKTQKVNFIPGKYNKTKNRLHQSCVVQSNLKPSWHEYRGEKVSNQTERDFSICTSQNVNNNIPFEKREHCM